MINAQLSILLFDSKHMLNSNTNIFIPIAENSTFHIT